eukprot:TRINITY_DN7091_c0_g3_i1.p1 TRINITY_DN7091_c0_g3~~TRINITY_DN7091_c0_g3_i1.p1  ORF type:complete len:520 (-),score=68.65 TRINITY_DN7091_c0_g3_i1:50-1609(-)
MHSNWTRLCYFGRNLLRTRPRVSLFAARYFTSSQERRDFRDLVRHLEEFSQTSSRKINQKKLKQLLLDCLRDNEESHFLNVIRILTCTPALRLGAEDIMVSSQTLLKVLSDYSSKTEDEIVNLIRKEGDVGLVAEKLWKPSETGTHVSLQRLIENLSVLSEISGENSRKAKEAQLLQIFKSASNKEELKYIVRLLEKSLRIGVSTKSVELCLNEIATENEQFSGTIRKAEENILGYSSNTRSIKDGKSFLGLPIPPMLCRAACEVEEIPKLLQKFSPEILVEEKFDGERTQIHFQRGKPLLMFSRNFERQEHRFLNLSKLIENSMKAYSCILDAEIVGFDSSTGQLRTFSELMSRARKPEQDQSPSLSVNDENVALYIFDIIELNGSILISQSLAKRKDLLLNCVNESARVKVIRGTALRMDETEFTVKVSQLLSDSLNKGLEGLIIKSLDDQKTYYDTKGRTQWIKLKGTSKMRVLPDTFDLTPIAAYWGKGKRKGLFGAFLMAALDPATGNLEALCE